MIAREKLEANFEYQLGMKAIQLFVKLANEGRTLNDCKMRAQEYIQKERVATMHQHDSHSKEQTSSPEVK